MTRFPIRVALATLALSGAVPAAAQRPTGHRAVDDFGPAADCATDDTPAFAAAMAQVVADGGGELEVGPHCYAVGALAVPPRVKLVGHWYEGSLSRGNAADPYTLAVNPSNSIALSANSALEGLLVVRRGLVRATDARSAVAMLAAFAGTAIIPAPGATDVSIRHLGVFGFAKAIDMPAVNERITIEDVVGDNAAGLTVNNSHDVTRVSGVHFWPFLTANFPWSDTEVPVSGASGAGGLVRLVTAAPHGLVTGDTVVVHDVAGVPAANGRRVVRVVDATTVDLVGSAFAGRFTPGPAARIGVDLLRRTGTGIEVLNSETTTVRDSFAYGYGVGIHIGDGAGWTQLIGDSVDGRYPLKDPTTTGLLVDGTAYGTSVIGGSYQAHGVAMTLDASGTTGTTVVGATINPGGSTGPDTVRLLRGRAVFVGNQAATQVGGRLRVADGTASVVLSGNDFPSWTVSAPAAARGVVTALGNVFAPGTPAWPGLAAGTAPPGPPGPFLHAVSPPGFAASGHDAATAAPASQQRVYVAASNPGGGISLDGHAVGADVIVFNGSPNAILVYVDHGAGTWAGTPSHPLPAGTVARGTMVSAGVFVPW